LQRFISEDPIGFNGGDINLYAYVWNNPIRFSDSYGLSKTDKLYGLSKKFWNWLHDKDGGKFIKELKDPHTKQVPPDVAREYHEEWKKLNEKGFIDPELLLLLLPVPPLLDELIDPDKIHADPCEMPGGPPCSRPPPPPPPCVGRKC
jgi:hypothetical protein